jgi:uncharacterized protein YdeI (BOF family)
MPMRNRKQLAALVAAMCAITAIAAADAGGKTPPTAAQSAGGFATSDMAKPLLTVTAATSANSYSALGVTGVIPLLAVVNNDTSVMAPPTVSVTVAGRKAQARAIFTDDEHVSAFLETPPELDLGYQMGQRPNRGVTRMAQNGFEFVAPQDLDYLIGTAVLTFYTPDGMEVQRSTVPYMFGYNPTPFNNPKIPGVIVK